MVYSFGSVSFLNVFLNMDILRLDKICCTGLTNIQILLPSASKAKTWEIQIWCALLLNLLLGLDLVKKEDQIGILSKWQYSSCMLEYRGPKLQEVFFSLNTPPKQRDYLKLLSTSTQFWIPTIILKFGSSPTVPLCYLVIRCSYIW